jgi:hypothetical protein
MTTNNEMKHTVLLSLKYLTALVEEKIDLLKAIDCDTYEDGSYDLNDQIMTFIRTVQELKAVINRSVAIVPNDELYYAGTIWDDYED